MPPLCKGRWHGEAVTEGLLPLTSLLCTGATIPQSALRLTAPFTQGSHSAFPDTYDTRGFFADVYNPSSLRRALVSPCMAR